MVCGDERPAAKISVTQRLAASGEWVGVGQWDIRYCNDREGCIAWATALGPWDGPPRRR